MVETLISIYTETLLGAKLYAGQKSGKFYQKKLLLLCKHL
jgi:hypothetical protein